MKITFPHMGNVYIVAKVMLDEIGVDYIIPPFNNKKALELGTKYAPEMACLPLKINLGNFIQAHELGADTILITGGRGPCRFGYYCEMHREILHDMGYDMDVIALEAPDGDVMELIRRIKKIAGGFNIYKILKSIVNTAVISKQIDELERLTFKIRPKEIKKGSTDRIYKRFLHKVMNVKGAVEVKRLIKSTTDELLEVEIDQDFKPLKIGIVGEIYTTIDPETNFHIAEKLGSMGVEVDRKVTISQWIFEHMIKKALHIPRDLRFQKEAQHYLGAAIGGHAQETIGHTIMYAKEGYDGVVQIYPLSCMPEIVAESILPAIERDFDIPIMTMIIDEMTGEAGYQTRIEAFVDLLYRRRERKTVGETILLPRN